MKKILIPISALFVTSCVHAQLSPTENYIYSKTYLSDPTLPNPKSSETVQYFDGLGRPKQIVNVKASPLGRDVVSHIEYDAFGRQTKNYLPIPQGVTLNGAIVPTPLANASQPDLYGTEKIYSEKILENSPLDRILQQVQVGNAWAGKPVDFSYDAATVADAVKKFTTSTTWENGATKSIPSNAGPYQDSQLYKNTVTDEDGNKTIEFKNGRGQLILARKVVSTSENADTYYVYNEYDQLAFVVPPLLAKIQSWSQADQDNLAYEYRYDGRGRLVEKKLPGKGWEFMVYDKADRLILSQDANLKKQNKWLITKYDQFGRVVYTGFLTGGERAARQSEINNLVITESRNTTGFTRNGMTAYYTDNYFVGEIPTILSVNYYDTYPSYLFSPTFPALIFGEPLLTDNGTGTGKSTKGLPVMSLVKNIEDDNWTKNYIYYDTKGRSVGSYSINHLGGYTKTESQLDFAGVVMKAVTKHKRLDTDVEKVITENFTYDGQNRLLVHKHQVDSNPEEILAQNKYNELSQLKTKKVGGIALGAPLQTIDYKYNIRGWMTHINDPGDLGNDLFGYKINYNNVDGLESPNSDYPDMKVKLKYNGNIAEISWRTLAEENEALRRYGYVYDPLNRLSAGFYQKAGNETAKEYFEKLDYDLNGNITRLKRSAGLLHGSTIAVAIDNLKYDYTGNKLTKITEEQIGNDNGYPYLTNPNIIGYDNDNGEGNGNMATHLDKGISSIQYNFLNLPKQIIQNSTITKYVYRADGVKVKKFFGDKIEVDYLDGFQYKSTFSIESWDGEGTYHPDPNEVPIIELRIIPTSEGYYDAFKERYVYNFSDHLGNVRLSYSDSNKDGLIQPKNYVVQECKPKQGCIDVWKYSEIIDVNNYYPFGLLHNYTATSQHAYQYKYNGKELQETGMYDYGARMYMPDLGRWGVIDPLAEKMPSWSPYAYSFNNPVRYGDPEGLSPVDWVRGQDGNYFWDSRVTSQASAEKYWGKGVEHFAPYKAGYDHPSGYILLDDNAHWIQNGIQHTSRDMAGTEPLGTKAGNFLSDHIVLEIEGKTSFGLQVGVKSSIGNADINAASFDVAGGKIDLINPSNSTGGWLNEAGSTKFKSGLSIGAGFKKTPISASAGIEHTWTEGTNSNPFGYNSQSAQTNGVGQIGFYKKGKGFGDDSYMKGGNLTGSVRSSCGGCINVGGGVKALLGIEANLKIGVK